MATQTIENLNTLDLETLASVEGGGCSWGGAGGATVQGAIGGAFGGNVVLPVVGSVPGYLAGAGGTVAYGATCWWS